MKSIIRKCSIIVTVVMSIFLTSGVASAYDLDYGGWAGWRNDTTAYFSGGQSNFRDAGAGNVESITPGPANLGTLSSINLCTNSTIPANSIISIPFEFAGNSNGNTQYPQASISANSWDYSVISTTYGEYGSSWILLYTDIEIHNCNLWLSVSLPYTMTYYSIKVTAGNWVKLKDVENWSSADKQNLFNKLNDVAGATSNTSTSAYQILEKLNEIQSQNQSESAQEQADRDNIEQQSGQINTDSESSQQSAESTGTTLLGAFTAFVGALTSASPSNCNLDMDLGNLDMGVVNLCSLSPPPVFQTISSIFLILFVVPLSIATARKVISLFRSFQ